MVGNRLALVCIKLKLSTYGKLSVWAITLSHPRFFAFASDSGFLPHYFKMFWSNRGAWHNIRGMGGDWRINQKLSLCASTYTWSNSYMLKTTVPYFLSLTFTKPCNSSGISKLVLCSATMIPSSAKRDKSLIISKHFS